MSIEKQIRTIDKVTIHIYVLTFLKYNCFTLFLTHRLFTHVQADAGAAVAGAAAWLGVYITHNVTA